TGVLGNPSPLVGLVRAEKVPCIQVIGVYNRYNEKLRGLGRCYLLPAQLPFQQSRITPAGRRGKRKKAMVQGYYTLEEAARVLGMIPDKLSQMAQRREIRAFADRGTWRFRTQDVEEMARRLGRGSSPELQLGEAGAAKGGEAAGDQGRAKDEDVFGF